MTSFPYFAIIEAMKKHKEKIYEYQTIFEPNGAGYTVTVPQLPGLVTEGDNLRQAREMAKDAIRCYIEALLKERIPVVARRREQVKVAVL